MKRVLKTSLLVLAGVLVANVRADAAWARVTSATVSAEANPVTAATATTGSLGAAVSVGHRILVITDVYNSDTSTVVATLTDSLGNTYTKDFSARIDSACCEVAVWSTPVTTGGTPTFTLHFTPSLSGGEWGLVAGAYSGLSTATGATAIDISKFSTGTAGPTASSGTTAASTTAANELQVGFYGDDGWGSTLVAGAGYTSFSAHSGSTIAQFMIEDVDSGASGSTATAGFSGTGNAWYAGVVVYKLAGGGPTTGPKSLLTLGVGGSPEGSPR